MSWVEQICAIERGLGATEEDLSSPEFLELLDTIGQTADRWVSEGLDPSRVDGRVVEVYRRGSSYAGRSGMSKRVDLRAILSDPVLRRELMVGVIVATQAREGVETTVGQAERAYDRVQEERCGTSGG